MRNDLPEIRCGHCGKLLARGLAVDLEIRCPRCGADNHVRAASPDLVGDYEPSSSKTAGKKEPRAG